MRYTVLVVALLAAGCAYHAPTAPTSTTAGALAAPTAATIRLSGSTRPDHQTDLIATVLADDLRLVPGVAVAFSTSTGTLSASSALTDAQGTARVVLEAASSAIVRAAVGAIVVEQTIAASPAPPPLPPVVTPPPPPPPPTTTVPYTVTLTAEVGFAGTPTYLHALASSVVRAAWSSGDGATATTTSPNEVYTYATAGTYTASVTVTDATGRTASASLPVYVVNVPAPYIRASLTCTGTAVGTTGTLSATAPVFCTVTVVDNTNAPVTGLVGNNVTWDWGNGSAPYAAGTSNQGTYARPGTYTVAVVVVCNGLRTTAQTTITLT